MSAPNSAAAADVSAAAARIARLRAPELLDLLPDPAYLTDSERRILFWNRAAERVTGWTRAEVVGHSCRDNILVHVDKDGRPLCGDERCPLHRAVVTGQSLEVPVLIYAQRKDGARIPVEVSVCPARDGDGRTLGGIEMFRDRSALYEDLRAASLIQRHCLEADLPEDGPLRVRVRRTPLDLVGGDFHRVARLADGRYAAMIADVMGHGVPAALFTMQLRVLWDSLHGLLGAPGAFLGALNERLNPLTRPDDYFATAWHAVVDPGNGRVVCAGGGHPPALLRDAGGDLRLLRPHGPAVGLLASARYEELEATVDPGGTLLLCSDGAVEVSDQSGAELGPEGLVRLCHAIPFTPEPDLAQLEEKILRYSNEVRLPDDFTLVSLTRVAS